MYRKNMVYPIRVKALNTVQFRAKYHRVCGKSIIKILVKKKNYKRYFALCGIKQIKQFQFSSHCQTLHLWVGYLNVTNAFSIINIKHSHCKHTENQL